MTSTNSPFRAPVVMVVTAVLVAGCGAWVDAPDNADAHGEPDGAATSPAVIEIRATDYTFDAPETVPAGWITYRLDNTGGHEIHEVSLARLPAGRSHDDYMEQVVPAWVVVWDRIQAGELDGTDAYAAAAELLPGWADDILYVRARGLLSPGRASSNTHYLEPGEYAIDCWVKAPSGAIHLAVGMSRPLRVMEQSSTHAPADADITIHIRNGSVVSDGELRTGTNVIAIATDDDAEADNVHLIRMTADTDPAAVIRWLNWYVVGGLQAPAPAEFLGGINLYGNRLPEHGASFTVENIEPGRYAWVVEGPVSERAAVWQAVEVR
jgi:hypothetical protein